MAFGPLIRPWLPRSNAVSATPRKRTFKVYRIRGIIGLRGESSNGKRTEGFLSLDQPLAS
jgi:hypothetical protein